MKRNHRGIWAAAVVVAAAMIMGSAGSAEARLGGGIRMPVDDTQEVNGIGLNHQVSDGLATLRRAGLGLIRPVMYILPEDWEWMKLPVYQPTLSD